MTLASPINQFQIHPIFSLNLGGVDLSFTNASLAMILACSIFYFFYALSIANTSIVPMRSQAMMELLNDFVENIMKDQLGSSGYKYFTFIFTVFIVILSCNFLGMIPYNFTVTSHLSFTFFLSLSIFFGVTIIGFVEHGLHFFSILAPKGVPVALLPLIISIEFVSYLTRAVSLGVRLAANMFAGHTLLKIISTFAWQMLNAGGLIFIAALFTIALLFALVGLELVIAFLQAYVFTVLTCSYLNDSINLH